MGKRGAALDRFDRHLVQANKALIGLMMIIMFALVFVNVVTRYVFGFSFATTEEISTFLMIWITYLGAGLALREGRHASIDMFQDLLPEKLRRALRFLLGILILLFFGALTFYGVKIVQFGWAQETWATQIPRGIPYMCVPIGSALFTIHLLMMFRHWIDREWDESHIPEAVETAEGRP